jgi:hypothetical protein
LASSHRQTGRSHRYCPRLTRTPQHPSGSVLWHIAQRREFMSSFGVRGFHRIRHYGLFASSKRVENITRARELLAVPWPATPPRVRQPRGSAQRDGRRGGGRWQVNGEPAPKRHPPCRPDACVHQRNPSLRAKPYDDPTRFTTQAPGVLGFSPDCETETCETETETETGFGFRRGRGGGVSEWDLIRPPNSAGGSANGLGSEPCKSITNVLFRERLIRGLVQARDDFVRRP